MASWHIADVLRHCNISFVEEEMEINSVAVRVCRAFFSGGQSSVVFHSLNTPNEGVLWSRLREFRFV